MIANYPTFSPRKLEIWIHNLQQEIKALEAELARHAWIPIDPDDPETWPEETVSVIVATFDGSVYGDYRTDSYGHGSNELVWNHSSEYDTKVHYWMSNPPHPLAENSK